MGAFRTVLHSAVHAQQARARGDHEASSVSTATVACATLGKPSLYSVQGVTRWAKGKPMRERIRLRNSIGISEHFERLKKLLYTYLQLNITSNVARLGQIIQCLGGVGSVVDVQERLIMVRVKPKGKRKEEKICYCIEKLL